MIQPKLIEHEALAPLMPHLRAYNSKGLSVVKNGGNRFEANPIERYAAQVAERVSELDNSLESLRMTLGFLRTSAAGPDASTSLYRYYYENFLFRTAGLNDRVHRFVGASLMLDLRKCERSEGNRYVQDEVKTDYPDIHTALLGIRSVLDNYRPVRNTVAHSSAYSTRELGLFSAAESVDSPLRLDFDVLRLLQDYSSDGAEQIESVVAQLQEKILDLMCRLAPVFSKVSGAAP